MTLGPLGRRLLDALNRAHHARTPTAPPVDVDQLVRIRIADAAARIAAARTRRDELDTARQAGLARRHAARLHRQTQQQFLPAPEEAQP